MNDGFDFIRLGIYFERADFARIIDVNILSYPSSTYVGGQIDNFQWSLMLRSVSSYRGSDGHTEIQILTTKKL